MKRILLLLLTIMLGLGSWQMSAQQIVEIPVNGGTATNSYLPSYCLYNYSLTQQIYTSAEIGMNGTISSIAFYNGGSYERTRDLSIYLVHTNKTSFSGSTDWITVTSGDMVYSGNVTFPTGAWTTITLSTPFVYDGVSNLAVIVDDNTGSWESSTSYYVFDATGMALRVYSDGTNYDPLTPSGYDGTLMDVKNQIQLGITAGNISCHAVGTPAVSNITAYNADITWGTPEDAGTYILQYKTSDLDWTDNGVETDYPFDTTYSFSTPLLPSTIYNVRIANMCTNGDTSYWRTVTFKTACAPIPAVPFTENFDTYGTGSASNYPDCWTKLSTYTSGTTPYISSTNYQGVGSLYFYVGSATQYNMAIMPPIDELIPINTLQVSFAYRASNATDRLIVGVMDDFTDANTFTPIDTVYPVTGNASTWDERIVTFDNYQGTGTYIAFKNEYTTTYAYAYVDNVTVDVISTCTKPTDVIITNYSTEGADVYWTPGAGEDSWEIVVVPANADVSTGTPEPALSSPYTLTGLNDNTTYDVYMRGVCGGSDYSGWTFKRTFTTNPECSSPLHVTVSQITTNSALVTWDNANFGASSYTVGYSEAGQGNWTVQTVNGNQFMISGLTIGTSYDVYVGSVCAQGQADSVTVNFTTRSCLVGGDLEIGDGTNTSSYFPEYATYNYSYTQQIYLASEMNGPANLNSITFDVASIATPDRAIKIYLMHTTATSGSSWLDANSAQLVFDSSIVFTTGLNTFYFSTPFAYNGIDNLALIVIDGTGSWSTSNTFYCHTTSTSMSTYYYTDSAPFSITSTPSTTYTSTNRNNVIFGVPCDSTTTCAAPNVYIASTTDNSATVAWTPGNTETSWELEYHTDIDTDWVSVSSVSSPYTITGLTSNTGVYVRVRALCGGSETSAWAVAAGRTECSIVNVLPLEENFDDAPGSGAGNMVHCWSTLTNYSTSYPYTSSSYSNSGNYSAYFYGTSAYFSYLVSPELDASIALNTLQVRFWAYKTSQSYYIQVGVMTDPNDYSTFTQVGGNLTPDTVNNWRFLDVNLDEYTGNGHYIALRIPQSYVSYMYVDDIAIDIIPTCAHVDSIQVSDLQPNGATFDWVPGGGESAWDVAIVPGTGEVDLDTVNIISVTGTPSLTVNDLDQNTIYTVYVRANCGSEQSFWMNTEFMTTQVPSTLPYFCDFEDPAQASEFAFVNGSQPHQWVVGTAASNGGTHSLYISGDNGATNSYSISVASNTWAYRDIEFPANPSGYTLSFDWRSNGESCCDYMRVFVGTPTPVTAGNMDQPAGSTGMVPNYNSTYPNYFNTASTYETFTTTLPGLAESTVLRIYFLWHNDGSVGTMPPASVDNISIAAISCDAPTALTVDSITANTAEISWTTTANSCVLAYRGENDPDWTEVTGITPPYQITNMTANTLYMVRVANDCEDGENVSPYISTSFYTACDIITTLPYTENFDSYTASTSTRPNCWAFPITYSNAPYITSNYYSSTPNSLYFQSATATPTTAVSPQFDADIHTLRAKFMLKAESITYSGTFEVGVMSDPTDVTTFESVRIIQPVNTSWNQYVVDFDSTTMTGQGRYIAFRQNSNSSSWYYWLDNVMIMNIPTCPEPSDLISVANTATSITLGWTPGSNESSWNIEYGTTGFIPGNGTTISVTTNPYEINNLESDSTYDFYVQADCGSGDESIWVGPYTIQPGTFIMPAVGNNTIDACALTIYDDGGPTENYGSNCQSILTINPETPNNLIAISGTVSTESNYDYLYIYDGVGTTGQLLGTYSGQGLTVPELVSTTGPLTLQFTSDGSVQYEGFALTVTCIPNTCPKPTGLTVSNVGTSSADLSWTPGGVENSWIVEYKEASASTWTTDVANTTSHHLTGLNSNTDYDVRVKADCGDETSTYETASFTTTGSVITDPTVATTAASNIGQTTATLNGTITNPDNVTITAKGFEWKATQGGTYTQVTVTGNNLTHNLTGLTANTGYTYKAFITFNGNTVYGSEMTFTTLPEDTPDPCDVPTGLDTVSVANESITVTWNANAAVNSWNIQYRPQGGQLTTTTSNTNTYTITNLTGNTTYEIQVQANCGDGNLSDWSPAITVTTKSVGIESWLENSVNLYPNPAKEYVDIRVDGDLNVSMMEVYDVYGKLVNTVTVIDNPTRINISGLANGMYFVRVTTEKGAVTKSFLKK